MLPCRSKFYKAFYYPPRECSPAMRTHWKLSPKTEKLRQKGNYLDLTATDELTAVRCITGSFRSFAHSLGDPVAYTSSTFMAALDGACEAFRKEYIKKKSDHFKGSKASIIGRFVQVILYSDGRISTFAYGGSTVTLLRNGTAQPFQRGEIAAQAGDLIVINLEGESSTQKMIENGGLDGIENDYPLLVFQIEQESTETSVLRPRLEENPAGAAGTPTAEKVASLAAVPPDQPKSEIPRAIDAQKGSGKKSKGLGWAALMVGLGLGAWMGYPYVANQLPELTSTFYPSLPDQAKKGGDEADEAGTLPSAQSPKTDSLLKIYYAKNPRELPLLDQAIQTLKEEQGTRAPGHPAC